MKARTLFIALGLGLSTAAALAKLPALSDEAKAKAAETAAKTAHNGKVDGYKLCLSMERVAKTYHERAKKEGKAATPPTTTAPCADPGPFVYTPPAPAPAPVTAAAPAAKP